MSEIVKLLETVENFNQLRLEVLDVVKSIDSTQIMCQGLAESPKDWITGTGRIGKLENRNERDYCVLNPALQGTLIEYYIKKFKAFRTRILVMPHNHCYSIHPDLTPRIHIPIVTNNQCWMIWPYSNQCHQLKAGEVYWTDTRKFHTFVNGSDVKRIHLVLCVDN